MQPKFRLAELAARPASARRDRPVRPLAGLRPQPRRAGLARPRASNSTPVALDAAGFAPLRLAGAWQLTSDDPRFGGISALAIDRGRLVALTDSGVADPLQRRRAGRQGARSASCPTARAAAASSATAIPRRWSAIPAAAAGGWRSRTATSCGSTTRASAVRSSASSSASAAGGPIAASKAIAADGGALLLIPEGGDQSAAGHGIARALNFRSPTPRGRISDAAAIGPGRFLAVERRLTPLGFRNALVLLDQDRTRAIGSAAGSRFRSGRSTMSRRSRSNACRTARAGCG